MHRSGALSEVVMAGIGDASLELAVYLDDVTVQVPLVVSVDQAAFDRTGTPLHDRRLAGTSIWPRIPKGLSD
jgi:hypothetical protein